MSYDLDNEQLMYSSNINTKIAPASITKLMTAILLLDNYKINDEISIKINKQNIEGKIAYMQDKQVMTVGNLLDFLLVYSANDAAHAAALAVSKTEDEFIKLMNDKAIILGMYDTSFSNVHGLDGENHFTTLDNILKLTLEAIQYDEIIVSTNKEYFYSDAIEGNTTKYYSTNELLEQNFNGLKTGWTQKAGLTFVGLYQDSERSIITIVNRSSTDINKQNHFLDTLLLKELSIQNFKNNNIIGTGDPIANIINGKEIISVKSPKDISIFGDISIKENIEIIAVSSNKLEYSYAKDEKFIVPLIASPKLSIVNSIFFWIFK